MQWAFGVHGSCSKNSPESDDLVKLVDRIGIIICGEKNAQHAGDQRIE